MAKDQSEFILDGIGSIPDGINSGILPQLLPTTQANFATNCTFRGGFIRNRPGLRKITLSFASGTNQTDFDSAIFQGAAYFKSEYGSESIIASIGGRQFEITPDPSLETALVKDITVSGDSNSPSASIAWLWQSERWMIINDGLGLPLFYDGATTRRSYGPSKTVGTTAGDFTVPAIGESVTVTLTAPYSGPYNSIVFIGNAYYQVNSSGAGYKMTVKNLSWDYDAPYTEGEPDPITVPAKTQVQFPNNLLGQLATTELVQTANDGRRQIPIALLDGSEVTASNYSVALSGVSAGPITVILSDGASSNTARWSGNLPITITGSVSNGNFSGTISYSGGLSLSPGSGASGTYVVFHFSQSVSSPVVNGTISLNSSLSGTITSPSNIDSILGFSNSSTQGSIAASVNIASSNVITVQTAGFAMNSGSVAGGLRAYGSPASTYLYNIAQPNNYVVRKYSPVFGGLISTTSPIGLVVKDAFGIPQLNEEVEITVQVPFNGPIGSKVLIGPYLFEVTASNNNPTPDNTVDVTNINDTAGNTVPSGTELKTVPELPVGKMGAYGMGRNWMCLPDGRSFIGGDIVGGSSGTPALKNRDSVLHVTENDYLAGGGAFVIPGTVGQITSMTFTATLDVALGQGPLQVGTPTSFFSVNAPVDRTIWQYTTNPILTQSLIGKGPLGQYGTLLVNSDVMFRALDGLGSLILARREFASWGNTPISREVQRVVDADNQSLLQNATAIQFDNRLLMGSLPVAGPLGVYHQGVIVMNFDPISSLRGKAPSIYDGFWTGLNVFNFVSGTFSNDERAFAFCYNEISNRIEFWELQQSGESEFDNDSSPLVWSFESASLFNNIKGKGPFDLIELRDGEIYISDIQGPCYIQVWFRPDYSACWTTWREFSICADSGPKQYRSRIGLGVPDISKCDPTTNRPYCHGNNFQIRIQVTGACKIMGLLLKAKPGIETQFSVPICDPLCDSIGGEAPCEPCADQGECQQFPLVYYNLNANKSYTSPVLSYILTCPDGTTRTVVIPAGEMSYTLPFPSDFAGPFPPLIMGCAAGGYVVRNIPDGSHMDVIDGLVQEMFETCGRALAESRLDCSEASPLVSNQEVFFGYHCDEGTLAYTGTLPSWITLDTYNSRLVGAAGIFQAKTLAEANAIAQNALDTFGNDAVYMGTLYCNVPSDCPTPTEFPYNNISTQHGEAVAYCSSNNTLWMATGPSSTTMSVFDSAATEIHSFDVSMYGAVYDIVYDSINDTFVVVTGDGDIYFVDPNTHAITDLGYLLHASSPAIAYDSTRGNILALDSMWGLGSRSMIISCASKSVIVNNPTVNAAWGYPVYCQLTDKYYVGGQSVNAINEVDPVSGAFSASSISMPLATEWAYRMIYCPEIQKMFLNTRLNLTYRGVRVLDMNSLVLVGELSGSDIPTPQWQVTGWGFNSCTDQLFASVFNVGVLGFEPVTYSENALYPDDDPVGYAFVRSTGLMWVGTKDYIYSL